MDSELRFTVNICFISTFLFFKNSYNCYMKAFLTSLFVGFIIKFRCTHFFYSLSLFWEFCYFQNKRTCIADQMNEFGHYFFSFCLSFIGLWRRRAARMHPDPQLLWIFCQTQKKLRSFCQILPGFFLSRIENQCFWLTDKRLKVFCLKLTCWTLLKVQTNRRFLFYLTKNWWI